MRIINKFFSAVVAIAISFSLLPCAYGAALSDVYIDIKDYDLEREYVNYITDRVGMGHYFASNGVGGKSREDSYLWLIAQSDFMRCSLKSKQGNYVYLSALSQTHTPIVMAFDIYENNALSNFFIGSDDNNSIIGEPIKPQELNAEEWNRIIIVFEPMQDTIAIHTFINNTYRNTNIIECPEAGGQVRFIANVKNYTVNKDFYLDNIFVAGLDCFVMPEIKNAEYINDDMLTNYYGMTFGDLQALLDDDGLKLSARHNGNELSEGEYITFGTEVVVEFQIDGLDTLCRNYITDKIESPVEKAVLEVVMPKSTRSNIVLPSKIGDVNITWTSNMPQFISDEGVVTRPLTSNMTVVLTALYSDGITQMTVNYSVIVEGEGKPTEIDFIDVALSSNNADIADKITYTMKKYDDYGVTDIRCDAACNSENIYIDNENRTILASAPGVYEIRFTAKDYSFEKNVKIAMNDKTDYYILSNDVLYEEDFEGVYDDNIMVETASIGELDGSNAQHIPANGMNQSEVFGPVDEKGNIISLSDYAVDADVYAANCIATTQANFAIRLRENSGRGYQFAWHDIAFVSEKEPNKVGTSAGDGFSAARSVFSVSKGGGIIANTWNYGSLQPVDTVYMNGKRRFNKTYHIRCMIMDNTFIGQVFDGNNLIYSDSVKLSELDDGTAAISAGATKFVKHSTEVYIDNVTISEPKWIHEIKIETSKDIISLNELGYAQVTYDLFGKSTNGEWIKLDNDIVSVSCSEGAEIKDGSINFQKNGTYSIVASVGGHACVREVKVIDGADTLADIYKKLNIENKETITEDFYLPEVKGYEILWESSDNSIKINDNYATVTRPMADEEDKTVYLTAVIYQNGYTVEKTFELCVKANIRDEQAVNDAIRAVKIPESATKDIMLPKSEKEGVEISWTSRSPEVISASGEVRRQKTNKVVNLIAVFKRGDYTEERIYVIGVPGTESQNLGGSSGGSTSGNKTALGGFTMDMQLPGNDENNQEIESIKHFEDIPDNAWYKSCVDELYKKGVIQGVSDTEYQPNRNITREEFTAILCRAFNILPESGTVFQDVDASAWYAPYIEGARQHKIISGFSSEIFGVGSIISRQDMCVMAQRIFAWKGINAGDEASGLFADDSNISDYARKSVYFMRDLRVISGKGENIFDPTAGATRAEVAVIIYRMMQIL